jgi:hypothetical protein
MRRKETGAKPDREKLCEDSLSGLHNLEHGASTKKGAKGTSDSQSDQSKQNSPPQDKK